LSKKEIDELKKIGKESSEGLDSLIKMLEDPEAHFKEHPIKEDWQDPPKAPTKAALDKALSKEASLTDKIRMYATVSGLNHFQKKKTKKNPDFEYLTDYKKRHKLENQIEAILKPFGYQVHTQDNVNSWDSMRGPEVLHFGIGDGLSISEIPRIKESNLDITEFIQDKNGKIRTYEELIKAYQEAKGPEPEDFTELTEDLDEQQKAMIKEFMESEDLTCEDISSIEEQDDFLRIDIYSRVYLMAESDDIAEKAAFEEIDNDSEMPYFYTEGIKSGDIDPVNTSFPDWIQLVKDDGWQHHLSRYDGNSTETKTGFVYWREN